MLKNHNLEKRIQDASWSKFIQMIKYKAKWYGRQLIFVEPKNTSKTCSSCGFINEQLELKDREWTCPKCGSKHDRDLNASKNILNLG